MRSTPRLALVLCLALRAAPGRAQEQDRLVLTQRLDCRGQAPRDAAGVPKNSILIVFDESKLNDPWILRDKAGIVAAVNQLLSHYGFEAVRAREYTKAESAPLFSADTQNHDVMLDYGSNSFLVELRNDCPTSGNTNGFPVCDGKTCGKDDQIFGPELRHYIDDSCVQGISEFSGFAGAEGATRSRAYLAALIVHEFIHAAHQRVLGDLLASEPASPPKPCPADVPLSLAKQLSRQLRDKLGLPAEAMHMSDGLMTAGVDLRGDPAATAGGFTPNMGQCLGDPKVPAALFRDIGALASSNVRCTEKMEPVSKFFYFPAVNAGLINRHLTKAAAAGCHSACYYRVQKAPVQKAAR